jgi:integrase
VASGQTRIVKIGHETARSLDGYIRVRERRAQAYLPQLWLGVNNRPPMTANCIYQMIARRGRQCGLTVYPHRFRHHFSHTWLDAPMSYRMRGSLTAPRLTITACCTEVKDGHQMGDRGHGQG